MPTLCQPYANFIYLVADWQIVFLIGRLTHHSLCGIVYISSCFEHSVIAGE